MSNSDGKALEYLVTLIEGILIPESFTIESREKIINDDGVQIAEFDIIIEGKIGSKTVRSLIECRDRPDSGAAPGSWIEQLIGRRIVYDFDTVMAVSTTGFSPAAESASKKGNIELRLVEDLTAEDIVDWLDLPNFTLFAQCLRAGVTIHPKGLVDDVDGSREIENRLAEFISGNKYLKAEPILNIPGIVENITLKGLLDDFIREHPEIFQDVEPDREPLIKTFTLDYSATNRACYITTEDGLIKVARIVFDTTVWIETIPHSAIQQYSILGGDAIAQSVNYVARFGDEFTKLTLVRILRN